VADKVRGFRPFLVVQTTRSRSATSLNFLTQQQCEVYTHASSGARRCNSSAPPPVPLMLFENYSDARA